MVLLFTSIYENSTTRRFHRKSDRRKLPFPVRATLSAEFEKKRGDLTEKSHAKVFMLISEHSICSSNLLSELTISFLLEEWNDFIFRVVFSWLI